jgi:site-specific recombinase XerD
LTRSGLLQLIRRLGKAAKIEACRCSPHTFRHTFAVEFLRAGGNVFTLKELLGHTTLTMTQRYVAIAQADIESQHRRFSPADRLKRGGNR